MVFEDKDIKPIGRALYNKLRHLARSRQERMSLAQKTAWALYEGKALEKVVDQIASLVDDVEKIFPVEWFVTSWQRSRSREWRTKRASQC